MVACSARLWLRCKRGSGRSSFQANAAGWGIGANDSFQSWAHRSWIAFGGPNFFAVGLIRCQGNCRKSRSGCGRGQGVTAVCEVALFRLSLPDLPAMPAPRVDGHEKTPIPRTLLSLSKKWEAVHPSGQAFFTCSKIFETQASLTNGWNSQRGDRDLVYMSQRQDNLGGRQQALSPPVPPSSPPRDLSAPGENARRACGMRSWCGSARC